MECFFSATSASSAATGPPARHREAGQHPQWYRRTKRPSRMARSGSRSRVSPASGSARRPSAMLPGGARARARGRRTDRQFSRETPELGAFAARQELRQAFVYHSVFRAAIGQRAIGHRIWVHLRRWGFSAGGEGVMNLFACNSNILPTFNNTRHLQRFMHWSGGDFL